MARIPLGEVRRFCIDCMTAVGTPQTHATALADVLVEADLRGHYSHGLNRLGSNHYGIAGWYSMQALKHNMLSALGTNPLTLAAPGADNDSFVLDMATTAVAVGKIEVQRRKEQPIPVGWAQGPDGKPTTDADLAFKTSALMPLGGEERTSGYKGYGLALLVETFCGILAGSDYGSKVRKWMDGNRPANLGQCFIAVNPSCFAPGFEGRMSDMMNILRSLEPADSDKPVLVPGDPERKNIEKVNEEGGVLYHENQLKASAELANELNVKPMAVL